VASPQNVGLAAPATTAGTQLDIESCAGTSAQKWTLPATTAPWAPAAVTATAGPATITITWTPQPAGGTPLTGYTITTSPATQPVTASPDATTATIAGLTPGTAYTVTVTARTANGTAGTTTTAITPGNEATYAYDNAGNLYTTSRYGTTLQSTRWDPNAPLPLAAEDKGPTGDYLYGPGGLAAMTTSGGTCTPASDWLGSVTGLISSSGTQVSTTTYGPWGTPSTTGSPLSSIGYAASYTLPGGTGLDDMRARDYNPATGQFTSVDPLLNQTSQPYAYADGNPVSATDATGTITCPSWLPGCGVATDIQNGLSSIGKQIWDNVYADNPCVNQNAAKIAAVWPVPTNNNCYECAADIQRILGGGKIIKISPGGGAPRLGPSANDPGGDWRYHYAIEKDGRIYDGFTGPEGLPAGEYAQQFEYWDYFDIE
jgi:RHS repeat-associated protein